MNHLELQLPVVVHLYIFAVKTHGPLSETCSICLLFTYGPLEIQLPVVHLHIFAVKTYEQDYLEKLTPYFIHRNVFAVQTYGQKTKKKIIWGCKEYNNNQANNIQADPDGEGLATKFNLIAIIYRYCNIWFILSSNKFRQLYYQRFYFLNKNMNGLLGFTCNFNISSISLSLIIFVV